MDTSNKRTVYIGILAKGWMRTELNRALVAMSHDQRYHVVIKDSWDRPEPSNRNRIALDARECGADTLIQIDADVWPYRNLLDCVALDKDVISFPVPIYRPREAEPPIVMNITFDDGDKFVTVDPERPLQCIWRGGGSCMMFQMRVFEALPVPWFEYEWDERGLCSMGADIRFFDKCRDAGIEVWTAYNYQCGHAKEVDLVDVYQRVEKWRGWDMGEKRDAVESV